VDHTAEVLKVNSNFYKAFEERNLQALSDTWAHVQEVWCTHPGWPALHGWHRVEESFRNILNGAGPPQFVLSEIRVETSANTAWVTLEENLLGPNLSTVTTVNVFKKTDGKWLMYGHHASPVVAIFS
jgi:ketosteroid isomerase-like protein